MDLKKDAKNNTKNVSTTRGMKGGYAFAAPLGTKVPASLDEKLDDAFGCLGFFSEDGWKEGVDASSETIVDMNGDACDEYTDSVKETIALTLIEMAANPLAIQYGSENVSETDDAIVVDHNWSKADDEWLVVLELLLKNGRRWRKVIPDCKVSERGEVTGSKSNVTGREITLTYLTDENGSGCKDYIERIDKPAAPSLDDMTVDQLKAYADEHSIDIAGRTLKADILAAIKAAEAEEEQAND